MTLDSNDVGAIEFPYYYAIIIIVIIIIIDMFPIRIVSYVTSLTGPSRLPSPGEIPGSVRPLQHPGHRHLPPLGGAEVPQGQVAPWAQVRRLSRVTSQTVAVLVICVIFNCPC